tara:strand:- start:609 stop:1625 length:1017 start_codon:yes stop_codon:yes gene_type:complete
MKNVNLNQYLISSKKNIKQTIIQINKYGLKLVCVVDDKNHLIGTVSDGDVRRGLLKNFTLENSIKKIMNKTPKFVKEKNNPNEVTKIFSKFKVQAIPVLDKNGKLIDILSFNKNNHFENIVYIVAGGRGKRMMPLTKSTPKPLLEYAGVPLLESILIKLKSQGFKNIVLSINYLGKQIEEYFKKGESFGLNINYIKENKEMGTAGSLAKLNKFHNNHPIIMSNSDLITNLDFKNLLNYHVKHNSDLTMASKKHEYQNPYGVIMNKGKKVLKINEKPIHTFNVNAGVYVIDFKLLKFVKKNSYLDMPNFIQNLLRLKKRVSLFPLHEIWKDIANPKDLK